MSSNLIVLSGEAGAGKDSVAKLLVSRHGWVLYSLAAPLKRFLGDMFGFTDEQLYGPSSARNTPDPRWARPCGQCGGSGTYTTEVAFAPIHTPCYECGGKGKVDDNSVRRIAQLLGDEWLRRMVHVDALTLRARPEIATLMNEGRSVVVNDARFSNDRSNLRRWLGAERVHVRAPGKVVDRTVAWRQHGSELDVPATTDVEYVLSNTEEYPFPSLGDRVSEMLCTLRLT